MKDSTINVIAGAILSFLFVTFAFVGMFLTVAGVTWLINAVVAS